jgi:ubiquinol-cytochrome c reductase cytochrome b subunit
LSFISDTRPERVWHLRHFRDPQSISPWCIMSKRPFTGLRLNDLTSYLLSFKRA